MKRALLSLVAGLAVLAAGCGSSSDKDKVRSTVETYVQGLAQKDGKKVCDQLTPTVQNQVRQRARTKDCATAIVRFEASPNGKAVAPAFKTAKVNSVAAKGNTAAATVSVKVNGVDTNTTIPLQKVNGKWKIASPAEG